MPGELLGTYSLRIVHDEMSQQTSNANDVNGTTRSRAGPASGRGGSRAPSVVIQRKPYSALDMRAALRIGTLNVRTLCETGAARLLMDELGAMDISIMGLQEVRWQGAGETSVGSYRLFWSGPPEEEHRQAGVALALSKQAASALITWHPVNSRILVARFKHRFGNLSVVVAYAPTNEATDVDKDDFYQTLEAALLLTKPNDMLICLGDFNAVSGTARDHPNVVGPHGSGVPNDNTSRFISFCSGASLRIAGSWYDRKDIHRYTWFSNDGVTKKEIDHILVNRRWKAISNCRVYRKLECHSDHRAVIGTFKLRLKRATPRTKPSRRYNLVRLQDSSVQYQYAVAIQNRFSALSSDESSTWDSYRDAHQEVAETVLGFRHNTRHEWISDETRQLVEQKREARLHGDMTRYRELNKSCKKSARHDKQRWADDKATTGEELLACGAMRDAFANFRQLRAACPVVSSPIVDARGNLVSDKKTKAECWKDYYTQLLNQPSVMPTAELTHLAAAAVADPDINCAEPTEDEVAQAIRRLKGGKAPGLCGITAEMIKASGRYGVQWLTKIIRAVWNSGEIPPDWRKGVILPFYKGKGSRKECKNYRGITLLSVPGKVFALVLLNRVKDRLLLMRRQEQSGFTPGRSTVDRISTLSNIIQTRKEYNRPLWIAYVDLKSAFDSVDRQSLWLLLKSIGLPSKILNLMEAMYTDTCSCVRADGVTSDWFEINCGVRQGCTMAPDLFLEPMNWIMEHTVHKGYTGVTIGDEIFTDLDYADDVALLAEMLEVLLLSLSVMNEEAIPLGLHINWSKTKIQQVGEPRCSQTYLTVAGENVEVVDSFVYLGSLTDRRGGSDLEIRRRIEIARNCMILLDKHIWRSSIRTDTKVRLYRTYIVPVLLYGSET